LARQLVDLQPYYEQVRPVMSELRTTVSSLPEAFEGMSGRPDESWVAAADKLDAIAAQLGDEADSLAAITPPRSLQSMHDVAIEWIRNAQPAVAKAADLLDKRAALKARHQAPVQAAALEALLSQLDQQLLDVTRGL
jgi:hypothetical protein